MGRKSKCNRYKNVSNIISDHSYKIEQEEIDEIDEIEEIIIQNFKLILNYQNMHFFTNHNIIKPTCPG